MQASTKERLLRSACEVFSERGYADATVAEICDRAGANIAAVNYHFSDKRGLYDAVWRHGLERIFVEIPFTAAGDRDAPPPERLKDFVATMLRRMAIDHSVAFFPRLMAREMLEPTSAHEAIIEEISRKQAQQVKDIICELTGDMSDAPRVERCFVSLLSQCVIFNFNRALREREFGAAEGRESKVAEWASHIVDFSLGGIRQVKESRSA
jgi:AcrR family transcriptional regulator